MIYAAKINEQNQVVQVQIVSDESDLVELGLVSIGDQNTVGLGWRFVGKDGFVPPVYEEDEGGEAPAS